MKFVKLGKNGEHDIGRPRQNTTVQVVITGELGKGKLTFGTRLPDKTFVPFTDPAPMTANGNTTVFLGKSVKFAISLTGSDAPELMVGFAADYFELDPGFNAIT